MIQAFKTDKLPNFETSKLWEFPDRALQTRNLAGSQTLKVWELEKNKVWKFGNRQTLKVWEFEKNKVWKFENRQTLKVWEFGEAGGVRNLNRKDARTLWQRTHLKPQESGRYLRRADGIPKSLGGVRNGNLT